MHWPRIRGLAASAGVRLRAKETEINAALWALEARERTLLSPTLLSHLLTYLLLLVDNSSVCTWNLLAASCPLTVKVSRPVDVSI